MTCRSVSDSRNTDSLPNPTVDSLHAGNFAAIHRSVKGVVLVVDRWDLASVGMTRKPSPSWLLASKLIATSGVFAAKA